MNAWRYHLRREAAAVLVVLITCANSLALARSRGRPPLWPEQFELLMVRRRFNSVSVDTLYYDWKHQRNLIITREQNNPNDLYDLELGSGRSYYYEPASRRCKAASFPVGILRPDWLQGSTYLGVTVVNDMECDTWTKANFIVYYAHVQPPFHPVRWVFLKDNMTQDVVRFNEGKTAPEEWWKVPDYCQRN